MFLLAPWSRSELSILVLVTVKEENLWTNAATIQSANVSITDVMEWLHWNNASIKKELEGGRLCTNEMT